MKTSTITTYVVIVLTLGFLVYGFVLTSVKDEDVAAKVDELTPINEKKAIDATILNNKNLKSALELKVYGPRPIGAQPDQLSRSNPFEGI